MSEDECEEGWPTHFDCNEQPINVGDVLLMDIEEDYGYTGEVELTVLELRPNNMVLVRRPGDGGLYPDETLEIDAADLYR